MKENISSDVMGCKKGAAVEFVAKYFLVIAFAGLWGAFWLIVFYFICR